MFTLPVYPHSRLGSKGIFLIAGFIWVLSVFVVEACPEQLPSAVVVINGHRLFVEVAATPSARVCGLSLRASLPDNQGMLFVHPSPIPLSFWMKDTEIPLSIAFLDDTGRILSIQKMTPMQVQDRYRSPRPARYALEVNQGWFETRGIKVGDVANLQIPLGLNIE